MTYHPEYIKAQNVELQQKMDMTIKDLLPAMEAQFRAAIGIDVNLTVLLLEPPNDLRNSVISVVSTVTDMEKLKDLFKHVTLQIVSGVEISVVDAGEEH